MALNIEAFCQKALPILPLLISMAVHFVFVCFYLLSPWLPAYVFSHLILFLVGLWVLLDREALEAVVSYIVVLAFTVLLDIIQLGLFYNEYENANGGGQTQGERTWQFSAACVIMNLLFKPLSMALAAIVLYMRAGGELKLLNYHNPHTSADDPEQ